MSEDLILRVAADPAGLTQVKALIVELQAAATGASARVSASAASTAASDLPKLRQEIDAAKRGVTQLQQLFAQTGAASSQEITRLNQGITRTALDLDAVSVKAAKAAASLKLVGNTPAPWGAGRYSIGVGNEAKALKNAEWLASGKAKLAAGTAQAEINAMRLTADSDAWYSKGRASLASGTSQAALNAEKAYSASYLRLLKEREARDAWYAKAKTRLALGAIKATENAEKAAAAKAAYFAKGRASLVSGSVQAELNREAAASAKVTAATKRHTAATKQGTVAQREFRGAIRGTSGALGGLWLTYTSLVPTILAFAAAASLKRAISEGAEFAFQMKAVQGLAQESTAAMDIASESVLNLGRSSLMGPLELAKGFRVLVQAGFDTASAMTALPHIVGLATVGQLSFEQSTKIAAGAMHMFNLEAADMGHVSDVIAKSASLSATSVANMGTGLGYLATLASDLKVPLEEAVAMMSTLATRNLVGSKAATSLQQAFLNLAAGTPKTKRALKDLGVSAWDATGKFRGVIPVLQDMRKALAGYTQEARESYLRDVFGIRGLKAATVLIAESADTLPEFTKEIYNASEGLGFANEALVLMSQTAKGQATIAMNNLQASLVSGANGAEEALMALASSAAEMFKSEDFQTAITAAIESLAELTGFLIEHRGVIFSVIKAYAVFKTAGIAGGLFGMVGGGVTTAVSATKVLRGFFTTAASGGASIIATKRTVSGLSAAFTMLRGSTVAASIPLLAGLPVWGLVAAGAAAAAAAIYLFSDSTTKAAAVKLPNYQPLIEQMNTLADAKYSEAMERFNKAFGLDPDKVKAAALMKQLAGVRGEVALYQDQLDDVNKRGRILWAEQKGGVSAKRQAEIRKERAELKALGASLTEMVTKRKKDAADLSVLEAKLAKTTGILGVAKYKESLTADDEAFGTKTRVDATAAISTAKAAVKDILKDAKAAIAAVESIYSSKGRILGSRRAVIGEGDYAAENEKLAREQAAKISEIRRGAEHDLTVIATENIAVREVIVKASEGKSLAIQKDSTERLTKLVAESEGLRTAVVAANADIRRADEKDAAAGSLATTTDYYKKLGALVSKSESEIAKLRKSIAKNTLRAARLASKNIFGQEDPAFGARTQTSEIRIDYAAKAKALAEKQKASAAAYDIQNAKLGGEGRVSEQVTLLEDNTRLQQDFAEQKVLLWKDAEGRITNIQIEEAQRRKAATIDEARSVVSSTSSILGSIADMIGENDRKSFDRAKKYRIAQAYMDTAAGAAGAFADTHGHVAIRIVAGVAALAAGMVRVRQIKQTEYSGQAHDGLDNVPKTGTYLLEGGERVVKKEDNRKLEQFLDRTPVQTSNRPVTVQLSITSMDPRGVAQLLAQNEGLINNLVQRKYDDRLAPGGPLR